MQSSHEVAEPRAGSAIMSRLKSETASHHAALERDLDFLNARLTRASLRAVLERFWSFHLMWEPTVEEVLASRLPGFFAPRKKLTALEQDLRYLDPDEVLDRGNAPPFEAIRRMTRWPYVLGSLYVLEGSTLGGQLISRALESRLGLSGGLGYSYFASYGDGVSRMWRSFKEMMEDTVAPSDAGLVVDGAVQTFTFLHRWLCTTNPRDL